jgi:hypothetical protein
MASTPQVGPISRHLLTVSVAGVVLTTAACTSRETPKDTTAAQEAATANNAATSIADDHYEVKEDKSEEMPRFGKYKGSIARDIKAYNAEEFRRFVRSRGWRGWARKRKCKEEGCKDGSKTTVMSAEAIEDSYKIDLDTVRVKERFGVIAGRLKNLGDYTDSTYGMPKGKEEWYLLWGGTTEPNQVRIVKLIPGQTELTIIAHGHVKACTPASEHPPGTKSEADLTGCAPRNQSLTAARLFAYMREGAWISCSQGCCTSDATPPFLPPGKDTSYVPPGKDTSKNKPPTDTGKP